MDSLQDAFQYFIDFEHELVRSLGKVNVNWEEVFADNLDLDPSTIIQVFFGAFWASGQYHS